jgi:hypothetical protein
MVDHDHQLLAQTGPRDDIESLGYRIIGEEAVGFQLLPCQTLLPLVAPWWPLGKSDLAVTALCL